MHSSLVELLAARITFDLFVMSTPQGRNYKSKSQSVSLVTPDALFFNDTKWVNVVEIMDIKLYIVKGEILSARDRSWWFELKRAKNQSEATPWLLWQGRSIWAWQILVPSIKVSQVLPTKLTRQPTP